MSPQRSTWIRRTGWLSATRRATSGSRRPAASGRSPSDPPPLDLSRDVVSLTGKESARETTWRIALRNNDGRYSRPGEGDLALLTKGSEIRIGLGYVTGSGRESSRRAPVWIDGFEHRRTDSSSTLIVRATGGWGLLAWQQARRERTWTAGEASLFRDSPVRTCPGRLRARNSP